jgi:hypothetical protein
MLTASEALAEQMTKVEFHERLRPKLKYSNQTSIDPTTKKKETYFLDALNSSDAGTCPET